MATSVNSKGKSLSSSQSAMKLSKNELDRITEVFKIYETGLREATIYPKVKISILPHKILNFCFAF